MTEQWRAVTRMERVDFYSEWLAASERNEQDTNHSPVVARGRDLTWVETPNDYRIAMLIFAAVSAVNIVLIWYLRRPKLPTSAQAETVAA